MDPRARRGRDQEAGRRVRGGGAAVQLEGDLGVELEGDLRARTKGDREVAVGEKGVGAEVHPKQRKGPSLLHLNQSPPPLGGPLCRICPQHQARSQKYPKPQLSLLS